MTLTVGLTACGGGSGGAATTSAGGSASSTPTATRPSYDTTWNRVQPDIAEDAKAKYGLASARDAVATAEQIIEDYAYDGDLILSVPRAAADQLRALDAQMTNDARDTWDPDVRDFVSQGKKASDDAVSGVYSFAFVAIHPSGATIHGKPIQAPATGPGAVNQRFTSITASVADDDAALEVQIKSSADLRVTWNGEPRLWRIARDSTLWLVRYGDDWQIDGWHTTWDTAKSTRPDRLAS